MTNDYILPGEDGTEETFSRSLDSIDIAITMWLDSKGKDSGSPQTQENYSTTLADARKFLVAADLDLDGDIKATALALQTWAQTSKRGGLLRPATVAQRLAVLSSFYDFARRRGLLAITSNPVDLVERPKVDSYSTVQPLDSVKVRRVLGELRQKANDEGIAGDLAARDLALLRVALTTGCRVSELAALRWGHVDVQSDGDVRTVTVSFQRTRDGRVTKSTLAPSVATDLLTWLRRFYKVQPEGFLGDAPIWPAVRKGGRTGRGSALSSQGIAEIVARHFEAHPHALRHSFAHAMRKAGAKDSEVQARLGHVSLATTGRYLAYLSQADNSYNESLADLFDGET